MTGLRRSSRRYSKRLVARPGMHSMVLAISVRGAFGRRRFSIKAPSSRALPNQALQTDDRLPRPHGLGRSVAAERQIVRRQRSSYTRRVEIILHRGVCGADCGDAYL